MLKVMMGISKILENAPKGLKLWSPIFGEVEFQAVSKNSDFKAGVSIDVYIPSSRYTYVSFNTEGKLEDNAPDNPFLWPSKHDSFWEDGHWQEALFNVGNIIKLSEGTVAEITRIALYGNGDIKTVYLKKPKSDIRIGIESFKGTTFPSEGEIQKFNEAIVEDKPEAKEKEKPWSLKPFDKFLYRGGDGNGSSIWDIGFFNFKVELSADRVKYFPIGGLDYFGTEVLPYNDETKHLHRTSEPRVGNWAMIPTILE